MADTKNSWMDGLLETQQAYWKSWAELAQFGGKTPEAPKNPWAEGINQWWQAVSPMAPPDSRAVFDRLMDMSKGYFSMAERFVADSAGKQDGLEVLNGWLEGMRKSWAEMLQGGAPLKADNPMKGMMTFWDLPMDTWNRMSASLMPMPGDFTQAFHPEGASHGMGPMRDQVNRFLSIPAVGYTRESQEQHQRLGQLAMDYAAATQAYQMAFGKLAMETAREFQQSVQKQAEAGKSITSLREIYDRWVELSEAAYARFVMTTEYQSLYGRLVNSLLALKAQMARMVDQGLEAMHMPTHAEISTLQRRQQELRRDNLRLSKEIKSIQEQLEAMRQRSIQPTVRESAKPVAKSVAKPVAKPAAKPIARTTAPAKPVAAKKPAAKPAARPASKAKSGGTKK